jgi:hypothetical protein
MTQLRLDETKSDDKRITDLTQLRRAIDEANVQDGDVLTPYYTGKRQQILEDLRRQAGVIGWPLTYWDAHSKQALLKVDSHQIDDAGNPTGRHATLQPCTALVWTNQLADKQSSKRRNRNRQNSAIARSHNSSWCVIRTATQVPPSTRWKRNGSRHNKGGEKIGRHGNAKTGSHQNQTGPHLLYSGVVPNKLQTPRPGWAHQKNGPRGHNMPHQDQRNVQECAIWPKRSGMGWTTSTRTTQRRCSPVMAKKESNRRDTVCQLCQQRPGDTPATQNWLTGNREHIHLACKHPKIQATRSAFATLVENAIKDLFQLIKAHLGDT